MSRTSAVDAGESRFRFTILGGLSIFRDGTPVKVSAPRRRLFLSILLAHAGDPVATTSMVDALWPDDPPPLARNVIHGHVSKIRRAMEPGLPARAQGSWLHATANGYRVVPEAIDLDLVQFRRVRAQARRETDPTARAAGMSKAIEMWRGAVGADVDAEWSRVGVFDSVNTELAEAATEAMQAAVVAGRSDDVLPSVRAAARLHPADERLHAELLRGLAASGRRAEALRHFEDLSARLIEEFGVEPGAAVREAHVEVLRSDEEPSHYPQPAQLPMAIAGFQGRASELARLVTLADDLVRRGVVALLTGAPGAGKTALAIQAAHLLADRYPDGQFFLDLRGFDPHDAPRAPRDVLGYLLTSLRGPGAAIPEDLESRAGLFRTLTADRALLLVLDNARDAQQVLPLLVGASRTLTVVTSRSPMAELMDGVVRIPVEMLPPEESVDFLASRLGRTRIAEHRGAVEELVRQVGGSPLALSVVSSHVARMPELSLTTLVDEVCSPASVTSVLSVAAGPRADLRRVFASSYRMLSERARTLFRFAALHPGPEYSVGALAALAGCDAAETALAAADLEDAGLLQQRLPHRYRMHDLLRLWANELVGDDSAADRADARSRLLDYASSGAVRAAMAISPDRVVPDSISVPSSGHGSFDRRSGELWLCAEYLFLVDLLEDRPPASETAPRLWEIAWGLEHFLDQNGGWEMILKTQAAAITAAQVMTDPLAEAFSRRAISGALSHLGRPREGIEELAKVVTMFGELHEAGDDRVETGLLAETHRRMAWTFERVGDVPSARRHARVAAELYPVDEHGSAGYAFALNAQGWYDALDGDFPAGLRACEAALEILDRGGDHLLGLADVHSSLGFIRSGLRNRGAAAHHYAASLRIHDRLGFVHASAEVRVEYARMLRDAHPSWARSMMWEAELRLRGAGHPQAETIADELRSWGEPR